MNDSTIKPLYLKLYFKERDKKRLDKVCGPGRRIKREAWVREALVAALDREEAGRA